MSAAEATFLQPCDRVLGIEIDGRYKAYPLVELEKNTADVHDTIAGQSIVVRYGRRHRTATAHDFDGSLLPAILAYWFVWYALHPDTEVYTTQ